MTGSEREDPDDNKKEKNSSALTTNEFMEYVKKGMAENKDTISAGMGLELVGQSPLSLARMRKIATG